MSDNMKRGLRSALHALLGFLATGGLDIIWRDYLSNHHTSIDPTLFLVIGFVLSGVASWSHGLFEDKTGIPVGPIPSDRRAGDAVLGTGLGAKAP